MEKAIENMDRKRLGILIRCLVILLITGVTNSAAVFVSPLAKHFNWTADAIANVSTTMLLCWTPGALIGGTLMSKIGAKNAMCYDIACACAGYVYGLDMARRFLACGDIDYALIVGTEILSRLTNYEDRSTCVLFGDGAGATVVRAADALYGASLGADGTGYGLMFCKNPPPASPFTHNPPEQDAVYSRPEGPGHMVMGGREVYKFATKVMPQSLLQACEKAGIQAGELDWIVPHQANVRIVQTAMDRLGLPMEKAWMTIDHTGNTSSASIPIALDELHRAGRVRRGDKIGLSGFGAGLIYASLVFEW